MSSGKKKTVVITGTSTGIGQDVTKLLAQSGWTVFAGVRKESDAERLRNMDPNIKPIIIDVNNEEQVKAALEQVRVAVGEEGLDALVNNAGLAVMAPAEFCPLEDAKKQYDINVFGVIRVTQAAMPLLRTGKPGRIINISSCAPAMNMPFGGMYCATKAAIDSFSECFRREVLHWGIKVSIVKPGPVKTNFNNQTIKQAEDIRKRFPQDSECYKYYGDRLGRLSDISKKFEKQTAHVSHCSRVIKSALTASHPKRLYYDTWGSYFTVLFIAIMPTWIYDKIIVSLMS